MKNKLFLFDLAGIAFFYGMFYLLYLALVQINQIK